MSGPGLGSDASWGSLGRVWPKPDASRLIDLRLSAGHDNPGWPLRLPCRPLRPPAARPVRGPRSRIITRPVPSPWGGSMGSLLAVDLGLRTGLAMYGPEGLLRWYRSQHFGSRAALRRGVHGLLDAEPDVALLVLEGGGPIADIWRREAERRGIPLRRIAAEDWRGR